MKLIFESNGIKPVFTEKNNYQVIERNPKNKQTIVLGIDSVDVDYHVFANCDVTPLVVLFVDGKKIQYDTKRFSPTLFANPLANKLALDFDKNKEMVGRYWANMVIRYKSKITGKHILTVFPDGSTVQYDGKTLDEALAELPHAGRRDANFQISARKALVAQYFEKHKTK